MRVHRWQKKQHPYQVGKDGFTLNDVSKGVDGWVKESFARPLQYELVWGRGEGRQIPVWWTGAKWEGLRLRSGDKILEWKQKEGWEHR